MDDVYLTRPWTFENYKHKKLSEIGKSKNWLKTIQNTIDLIGDCESFETHCPIVYNSGKVKSLNIPEADYGYCVKTIYCNKFEIKGVESNDLKITKPFQSVPLSLPGQDRRYRHQQACWLSLFLR